MKTWQDKVITITAVIMGVILIPMVLDGFNGNTVNVISSAITATGLFVIGYCFWTIKLKLSFGIYMFNAALWMILLLQALVIA